MWIEREEQRLLTVLGVAALLGCGAIWWQRQRPPLTIVQTVEPARVAAWDLPLAHARQVDINTAGVAELERLPQVGPALARRIVIEREAHGPFRAPEELSRVKGIGAKTFAALEDYITVTSQAPPNHQ